MENLSGKKILITGGTGSIGQTVVARVLSGENGTPKSVWIFSRDEGKQFEMQKKVSGSGVNYLIGDIRDYSSVADAVEGMDYVIHAAAMKHVPACEYEPFQAVLTNIMGTNNIIQAIRQHRIPVESVVAISTDKCCAPTAVMGMTKAIMERCLVRANIGSDTRFNCVRSGNVIGSTGSVVPLFISQAVKGEDLTVTGDDMTRFFITRERLAEKLISVLLDNSLKGIVYVPQMPSIKILDLAEIIIEYAHHIRGFVYTNKITKVGYRPGERAHEIIISTDESSRMQQQDEDYIISSALPELSVGKKYSDEWAGWEYNSRNWALSGEKARETLKKWGVL